MRRGPLLPFGLVLLAPALVVGFACGDPYSSSDTPPAEAGVDSGPGGDASGTTDAAADGGETCARADNASFSNGTIPVGWVSSMTGGGTVDVDSTNGSAAPGALRSVIAAGASTSSARIERTVSVKIPRTVRVAFAMRIAQGASSYFEPGCVIQVADDAGGSLTIESEVLDNVLQVDDYVKLEGLEATTAPPFEVGTVDPNHWYKVTLEVHLVTPTMAHATVAVDSTTVLDREITLPVALTLANVRCGIDFANAGVSASVYVDDVTVDLCN